MRFCPRSCKLEGNSITKLFGNNLVYVESGTYLGHILTCRPTRNDEADIKRQYRSLCIRSNSLNRKFMKCSTDVKCCLFRSYCINMYCATLWSDYRQKNIRSLNVCYNNALRRILKLPRNCSASMIFVEHGVPSFSEYMRKSVYSFMTRILISSNTLVKCVCDYMLVGSTMYGRWRDILHV